MENRKGIK